VPFANASQRQYKPYVSSRYTRLIGMRYNARIEQRRRLERIFFAEMGADQKRLLVLDRTMVDQQNIHFVEAPSQNWFDVTVMFFQAWGHTFKLDPEVFVLQRKDPVRDSLGPRPDPRLYPATPAQ